MIDLSILRMTVSVMPSLPWSQPASLPLFLYLGPETVLPVASILASIIGVILMFWRLLLGMIRKLFRRSPQERTTAVALEEDTSLPVAQDELPKSNT